jgi:hypothetical protein
VVSYLSRLKLSEMVLGPFENLANSEPDPLSMFSVIALTSLREATGGRPPLALNQEETRLLCKMSPASHFFFLRKLKKIMIINLFTDVVKKLFGQTFSPASRFRCIFKNSDSQRQKGFFSRSHDIACNRMQSQQHCMQLHAISATSHAIACDLCNIACDCIRSKIAWQSGVESCTTRRIEFDK